jgi:hypothetical protein
LGENFRAPTWNGKNHCIKLEKTLDVRSRAPAYKGNGMTATIKSKENKRREKKAAKE